MRYVQFTQPFAQQFRIIVIIVDVRQELAVSCTHGVPIHTMHIHVVETFFLLLINMVEHRFTLCYQIHFEVCCISNRSKLSRSSIHFLHTSPEKENSLSVLAHLERSITHTLIGQLHVLLAEIKLPKVHTSFERSGIIKVFALLVDDGTTEAG